MRPHRRRRLAALALTTALTAPLVGCAGDASAAIVASEECIVAVADVADVSMADDAAVRRANLAALDVCQTGDEFLYAARRSPASVGLNRADVVDALVFATRCNEHFVPGSGRTATCRDVQAAPAAAALYDECRHAPDFGRNGRRLTVTGAVPDPGPIEAVDCLVAALGDPAGLAQGITEGIAASAVARALGPASEPHSDSLTFRALGRQWRAEWLFGAEGTVFIVDLTDNGPAF